MKLSTIIQRLRLLPTGNGKASTEKKLTFLAELLEMGFRVENASAYDDGVLEHHAEVIQCLKEMRGGDVDYVPLFQGFPDTVPDDSEHLTRRLLGMIGNHLGTFSEGKELENGLIVPEWLFDLNEFGADPITQWQTKGLYEKGLARQQARKGDTHTEWTTLRFANSDEVDAAALKYLLRNLYAKSSIKEALKPDIEALLAKFSADEIDPKRVVFKETRTYVMKFYWQRRDWEALARYCDTPTDLLRLFAALTDSDVSLATPIKFPHFKRPERKFILGQLEGCSLLEDDLVAYKGLWLELGRYLHPGEYAKRFPRTYAAFDQLRNGKIVTWNSKVETALERKDLDTVVELLLQKPGIFARRIHHVLELAGKNAGPILSQFESVIGKVQLKNLLVLSAYFATIEDSERRAVINKRGGIRVLLNKKHRLEKEVAEELRGLIKSAIYSKIGQEFESWEGKKVWVDPEISQYTVPLQQRTASDGLLTIGRGSRLPLDLGKVLRLFVWWKNGTQTTDLDLSLIKFNDKMEYTGHVSFTNLSDGEIFHSGDITDAPLGAAEFIDVSLSNVAKMDDCRYLAAQIHVYDGDYFPNMDCHSGWMIRDKVDNSYASFDLSTVQHKFDLNGAGRYAIPILVDLKDQQVIFIDLYVNGIGKFNTAEGSVHDTSLIALELARMVQTRPNLYDLANFHAIGRGAEFVQEAEKADIQFSVNEGTYTVSNIEQILSELL